MGILKKADAIACIHAGGSLRFYHTTGSARVVNCKGKEVGYLKFDTYLKLIPELGLTRKPGYNWLYDTYEKKEGFSNDK